MAIAISKAIAAIAIIFSDRDQCNGGNGKLVIRTNSKSKTRYV
ncbi:hypothetical protein FEV09_20970 [Pseudanabaena catenata USMAC16]|uniref:Uncharacterized protein n=1 Tax=Pseudanabaena catenata USMAC16 TaxID=1855837 RepID=A0A9X4MDA2_9CYAN|nr:hypothetical protein [Pseudanabaena catenata]MDG3497017.1 hypothetical protein [Pseudanabaena catenata USMAC16]